MTGSGGLRELFNGDQRIALEDEHTAKTYELYRSRTKMVNALLSIVVLLGIIAIFVAAAVAIAFVVWTWRAVL